VQIVLESPLDVTCFKWNPTQPNLIIAGCISGQILLYDVSEAMGSLSKTKSTKSSKALAATEVCLVSFHRVASAVKRRLHHGGCVRRGRSNKRRRATSPST
jgi:hypothetical protein